MITMSKKELRHHPSEDPEQVLPLKAHSSIIIRHLPVQVVVDLIPPVLVRLETREIPGEIRLGTDMVMMVLGIASSLLLSVEVGDTERRGVVLILA